MLLRTLFLGKTGLVVRWLVLKQPFLPFLTQPGPSLAPKGPNKKFLKEYFSQEKIEIILLSIL